MSYQEWRLAKFLEDLDKAGYAIVRKPRRKPGEGLSAAKKEAYRKLSEHPPER